MQRYRVPTALERQGDFSRTTDNLGNLYNFIKDPRITTGVCNATSQAACFADGGVLGKIPANMLYQTGLNILNMFPLPTIDNVPVGQAYNFEVTRPNETILAWQPGLRLDYQAVLVAARSATSTRAGSSAARSSTGRCPASTTRRCSARR